MKNNFTKFLMSFIFVLTLIEIKAQDGRYAQFYRSPAILNPAMSGAFSGEYRFVAHYRDQWSSVLGSNPYRSFSAGIDRRFAVGRNDFFSLGIHTWKDHRVGAGDFDQNRVHLNGTFTKQLSGGRYSAEHFLLIGGQLGAGQNKVKSAKLWFTEQYDPRTGLPNTNNSNGEANIDGDLLSPLFIDLNAGLMWYAVFDENKSLYAGTALFHLNGPNVSLLDNQEEELYSRWVIHAGGEWGLNKQLSILPAVAITKQGPATSTSFGANFRYTNKDWNELAIRAGLWSHLSKEFEKGLRPDAWIFTLILDLERWSVGLSYDVNASDLEIATDSRGAFELSVQYTHPAKRKIKVTCPNF